MLNKYEFINEELNELNLDFIQLNILYVLFLLSNCSSMAF